jgi:hypothetical protein
MFFNQAFKNLRPTLMQFVAMLLMVFFVTVPAVLAGNCRIESGPDWIRGKAEMAPLGHVLKQLSEKTGYSIFVDQDLLDEPVSFEITGEMESEDALRRIIHPHSSALVYNKKSDGNGFDILEVRIYTKGRRKSVRYVPLNPPYGSRSNSTPDYGVSGNRGRSTTDSASSSSYRGRSGITPSAHGSLCDPRATIRQRYGGKKGAFGQSMPASGNSKKGPDLRPSASEMKQAYTKFKQDKKDYRQRSAESISRQSQSRQLQSRGSYRDQRNQALKKYYQQQYR